MIDPSARRTSAPVIPAVRPDVGPEESAAVAEVTIEHPLPVHHQPYVLERGIHADLPVTDAAADGSLSLPMYAGLRPHDEAHVVAATRAAVRRHVRDPIRVPDHIPVRSASVSR